MQNFHIHARNARFETQTDVGACATAAEALAIGVRAAIGIATDEIVQGTPSSSVVVTIKSEDGLPLLRSAISLCVASLCTD